MEDASQRIRQALREYILSQFLPGEDAKSLDDDTPLITGGILDSIKIMRLVIFLEETHGFEFRSHEMTADYLDTVERIARIVQTRIEEKA